ncbi:MAG TPA: MFS transporter [Planctomycetes bacterium]|nr:MFS transporter [Planctomycetota bacterium]
MREADASDGQAGGKALPLEVKAWGVASFFSDLSHEAVTCVMPALLIGLGAGPVSLGVIEGLSDALASVAKFLGGKSADTFRRLKPWVVGGYLLTSLAMPAVAWAKSWGWILGLRGAAWIGRGFRSPMRDTLLARTIPKGLEGRAFGLERAMDQSGALLAPLVAAALLFWGWSVHRIIVLTLLPGLVCVGVVAFFVKEHPRPRRSFDSESRAPVSKVFRHYLFALGVFGSGDFAKILLVLWALGPEASEGAPLATFGRAALLYAFFNLVTVASAYIGGLVSDAKGRKPILVTAYGLGALGALVPVLASPGWVTGAFALFLSGCLVGTEESVERAWAADLAGDRHGHAFGWMHTVNGMGDLIASATVGWLWETTSAEIAFGAAAALMGLGALLTATVPERSRAISPQ